MRRRSDASSVRFGHERNIPSSRQQANFSLENIILASEN